MILRYPKDILEDKYYFFRYDLGSGLVFKVLIYIRKSLVLATIGFTNSIFILRFIQVIVWKRVLEFDEDLLNRIISTTIFTCSAALAFLYQNMGNVQVEILRTFAFATLEDTIQPAECFDQQHSFQYR